MHRYDTDEGNRDGQLKAGLLYELVISVVCLPYGRPHNNYFRSAACHEQRISIAIGAIQRQTKRSATAGRTTRQVQDVRLW